MLAYQALRRQDGKVGFEVTNGSFAHVNGIILPKTSVIRNYFYTPAGERTIVYESNISVTDYRFNSPENVPTAYEINWPAGTGVLDERTGVVYKGANDGHLITELENSRAANPLLGAPQPVFASREIQNHEVETGARLPWIWIAFGGVAFVALCSVVVIVSGRRKGNQKSG